MSEPIHHRIMRWFKEHHLWDVWSGVHAMCGAYLAVIFILLGLGPALSLAVCVVIGR